MRFPEDIEKTAQEAVQLIHGLALNHDVRRPKPDGALEKLLTSIIYVGIAAVSEEQAIAAYNAGLKGIDKALLRIAKEAQRRARGKPLGFAR